MSPLFIVSIDQILDFESDSRLKCIILAMLKYTVANGISIVKVDDLVASFFLIFQILLGLSTEITHQLVHHVAHDFNVLVV